MSQNANRYSWVKDDDMFMMRGADNQQLHLPSHFEEDDEEEVGAVEQRSARTAYRQATRSPLPMEVNWNVRQEEYNRTTLRRPMAATYQQIQSHGRTLGRGGETRSFGTGQSADRYHQPPVSAQREVQGTGVEQRRSDVTPRTGKGQLPSPVREQRDERINIDPARLVAPHAAPFPELVQEQHAVQMRPGRRTEQHAAEHAARCSTQNSDSHAPAQVARRDRGPAHARGLAPGRISHQAPLQTARSAPAHARQQAADISQHRTPRQAAGQTLRPPSVQASRPTSAPVQHHAANVPQHQAPDQSQRLLPHLEPEVTVPRLQRRLSDLTDIREQDREYQRWLRSFRYRIMQQLRRMRDLDYWREEI